MSGTLRRAAGRGQRVFSWAPAKLVGMYQMLSPDRGAKARGYNACHAAVLFGLVLPTCAVCALCPVALYRLAGGDTVPFVFYLGTLINFLLATYKMTVIARRSDDIWQCLEVGRSDFLRAYRRYDDADMFLRWRAHTVRFSWALLAAYTLPICCFAVSPYVPALQAGSGDGRNGSEYRMNIYNMYVPLLDAATYNRFFNVLYVIEMIPHVLYCFSTSVFDLSMAMMCLSICCQLERIRIVVEQLGHSDALCLQDDNRDDRPIVTDVDKKEKLGEKSNTYDDLQCIIADHQKVLKKMIDYYNIIQPIMLAQIFVAASSYVFIWFIFAMTVFEREVSNSVTSIKLFCALPVFTFQMFMTCYLFSSIDEYRDSIGFALYSSNWTEMSEKSRKLVLLAMSMNNANQLQMRFTYTQIVNLEMFAKTMRFCYSMFSMLLNNNKNK